MLLREEEELWIQEPLVLILSRDSPTDETSDGYPHTSSHGALDALMVRHDV